MTYALELTQVGDIEFCYEIIKNGRKFQKEQGFVQWTDDYPNLGTIKDDVNKERGYVIKAEGQIAGYMCIDFDGEPAYNNIEGKWETEESYAVVHRMAINSEFRDIGLADITFHLIDELCIQKGINAIRVDTDFPNKRMQHILERNGFKYRGVVVFQGSGKRAYDKSLSTCSL